MSTLYKAFLRGLRSSTLVTEWARFKQNLRKALNYEPSI
jgi:hypothetical protein